MGRKNFGNTNVLNDVNDNSGSVLRMPRGDITNMLSIIAEATGLYSCSISIILDQIFLIIKWPLAIMLWDWKY